MFLQFIIANLQQMEAIVYTSFFVGVVVVISYSNIQFCLLDVFRVFFDFLRVVFFFSLFSVAFIKHNKQYQSAAPGSSVYMSTKISDAHAHMLPQTKCFLVLCRSTYTKPISYDRGIDGFFVVLPKAANISFLWCQTNFRRQFYVLAVYAKKKFTTLNLRRAYTIRKPIEIE